MNKEDYEKAESYISFFPEESTDQKLKAASIYSKTNREDDAYRIYEEILFSEYQTINIVFHNLFQLSMEEKDHTMARMWVEKESGLARLFDMGIYREECCRLELAAVEQDREQTYSSVQKMLDSLEQLCSAVSDSCMYRHMKFSEPNSDFYKRLRKDLIQRFREKETFYYMKGHSGWEKMIL